MERIMDEKTRLRLESMETVEELIGWVKRALTDRPGYIIDEKKRTGNKIIGFCCIIGFREILDAAGVIYTPPLTTPVEDTEDSRINTTSDIAAGERYLPKTFCPIPKSMLGRKIKGNDPLLESIDLFVTPSICDCRTKAFEYMAQLVPTYMFDVPKKFDEPAAFEYFKNEVGNLRKKLETFIGHPIPDDAIAESARIFNRNSELQYEHCLLRRNDPVPITSTDSFFAMTCDMKLNVRDANVFLEILNKKMRERVARKEGFKGVRLILAGAPLARSALTLYQTLADCGVQIVAEDTCAQARKFFDFTSAHLIDLNNGDIIHALAKKHMRLPCAIYTPNSKRIELLENLVKSFNVKGVIYHALENCAPFNAEYEKIKAAMNRAGFPVLRIDNTFATSDREQQKLRVQGFLEMVGS